MVSGMPPCPPPLPLSVVQSMSRPAKTPLKRRAESPVGEVSLVVLRTQAVHASLTFEDELANVLGRRKALLEASPSETAEMTRPTISTLSPWRSGQRESVLPVVSIEDSREVCPKSWSSSPRRLVDQSTQTDAVIVTPLVSPRSGEALRDGHIAVGRSLGPLPRRHLPHIGTVASHGTWVPL